MARIEFVDEIKLTDKNEAEAPKAAKTEARKGTNK